HGPQDGAVVVVVEVLDVGRGADDVVVVGGGGSEDEEEVEVEDVAVEVVDELELDDDVDDEGDDEVEEGVDVEGDEEVVDVDDVDDEVDDDVEVDVDDVDDEVDDDVEVDVVVLVVGDGANVAVYVVSFSGVTMVWLTAPPSDHATKSKPACGVSAAMVRV